MLAPVAERTGIDPAYAVAVICVESSGTGYGPGGRLLIRFESHVFRRRLPAHLLDRFEAHFGIGAGEPWRGHVFRASTSEPWTPFHGSQAHEWRVFEFACGIDETAAHAAISMGLPQIMGFNHAVIGYDRPQAMRVCFQADVRYQLLALFDFVAGTHAGAPALAALRRGDLHLFASLYNGPGQVVRYAGLLEAHVEAFRRLAGGVGAASPVRTHVVQRGETLGGIARRYGTTVGAIAARNGIANPDHILAGQVLALPETETS